MRLLLYTHPACWEHDTGGWHPERAARLDAAIEGVRRSSLEVVERQAPEVPLEALYAVHGPGHVERVREFISAGGGQFDADTVVSPGSWDAALRAAGAGLAAVEALRQGEGDTAFLVVRPPGHHALPNRPMGFCLFNNVGVAAAAIAERGEKVAIVDWDVHHGNATQDMFYTRRDVLYISTHQFPFYPGTGWIDEVGSGEGEGFNINIPIPAGTAGDAYDDAFDRIVVPVLEQMHPDWILVSAGFDGHADDPMANVNLREPDFGRMALRLARMAPERFIFFLEGGYELGAITSSVTAALDALSAGLPSPTGGESPPRAHHMVQVALAQAAKYWDIG